MYLKQIGEENRTEENIEELDKAFGVMNRQKTDEAIKENFEKSLKNPIASPTEVYVSAIFRNGNGYFNYPPKVGYKFNFHNDFCY